MPSVLAGEVGQLIFAMLVLASAGLLAFALFRLFARDTSELSSVLAPYSDGNADENEEDDDWQSGLKLVKSDVVKRAVAGASRLAIGRRAVPWLERRLDQANVPLRAAEALVAYVVVAMLLSILAFFLIGPVIALGVVAGLTALPLVVLSFLARRRRVKFTAQLPDALKLLSGTLRAGFSLAQGMETLAAEVGEPMGAELQRVLSEARLGRPIEDALTDMATRLESEDFEWTVMAIGIQREVGGNLAELLDTVADTMQARERLRGEVKALTAEGRISAIVIACMPVGLGAFMWMANRDYISTLTENSVGQMVGVGAMVLAAFGFWWMKKTIEIEV